MGVPCTSNWIPHRAQQLGGVGVAATDDLVEGVLGMVVPVPGVLEGLDLRVGAVAGLRLEQDVVIGVRVERRVEVDEVDALARDMLAQNVEIVAVEQLIGHRLPPNRPRNRTPRIDQAEMVVRL